MANKTDSPQVIDSPRADSEWKADPGLSTLVHGSDGSSQEVNRSNKNAPLPEYEPTHEEIAHGQGSVKGKDSAGSGKGALKDTQINQER